MLRATIAPLPICPFCLQYWKRSFCARSLPTIIDTHNLLSVHQSAYREGHVTKTALLSIMNDIICALAEDKIAVLLPLDLSAAFNTMDHEICMSRRDSFFSFYPQYSPSGSVLISLKGSNS